LVQREPEPAPEPASLVLESIPTLTTEEMEGKTRPISEVASEQKDSIMSAMNEPQAIAASAQQQAVVAEPLAIGNHVQPEPTIAVPEITAAETKPVVSSSSGPASSETHHTKLKLFPNDPPKDIKPPATEMIDIAIVVPTVRRYQQDHSPAPERYLAPMVNKLWADLQPEDKPHVKFFILNSDREPEKHIEAEGLREHPGVTVFTKVANKEEIVRSVSAFSALEDGREVSSDWLSWVASENVDGAFLFEKAKAAAPYILFLEDDVWPTTNALRKLSNFVRDFEKAHNDWLFLDLYTPNLDWAPGMLNVENGGKYPFQCCTQSMLFKSSEIDGVIHYWRSHSREPVDDNLRNYIKEERPDLSVYALRPNLFQHVGAYSSNAEKSFGIVEHESIEFIPLL